MKPGWYILNYHEVNWEASLLVRGLGGTVTPDVFRSHLESLRQHGELISVQEGYARLRRGARFTGPAFSLWFDDGFAGVRKYALPICSEFGVTGAVSVCSRFAERTEMFWRAILSYFNCIGSMNVVRARLRPLGYDPGESVKAWTISHFSLDLVRILNELFESYTTEAFRKDCWRIFEPREGLQPLADQGWVIANHGAAHYPLGEHQGEAMAREQFEECERMVAPLNREPSFWVIPFEHPNGIDDTAFFKRIAGPHPVVRVREKFNTPESFERDGALYRMNVIWNHFSKFPVSKRIVESAAPVAAY